MRPSRTPMSSAQPFEHRTHADCTHRSGSAAATSSTRSGQSPPAANGVRTPHGSVTRSRTDPTFSTRQLDKRGTQTADPPSTVGRRMRRLLDLVLLVAILGGLGYGAYRVGQAVTDESDQMAEQSQNVLVTTAQARVQTIETSPSLSDRIRDNEDILVLIAAGVLGVILVVSLSSSVSRSRRRRAVARQRKARARY